MIVDHDTSLRLNFSVSRGLDGANVILAGELKSPVKPRSETRLSEVSGVSARSSGNVSTPLRYSTLTVPATSRQLHLQVACASRKDG